MLAVVGALIGVNLCVRIVLGETRQRRLEGRAGLRGASRLRIEDYWGIAWRGLLFLVAPIAIGLLLDTMLGTSFSDFTFD